MLQQIMVGLGEQQIVVAVEKSLGFPFKCVQ